jgi:methyl-accepting chemotaxis protein
MSMEINVSEHAALLIGSHLQLDAAIVRQLKEVVSDTEHAAMQLMNECQKLSDAANIFELMLSQPDSSQEMKAYRNEIFKHNHQLAAGIGEIIGHIQFQDGVRQRIERIETAIAKRNVLFLVFAQNLVDADPGLLELPVQMREILDEYLAIEQRHAAVSNDQEQIAAGTTKFEFF